ncbi:MAG: response regulator [Deltaproteobacteria bacterium]|jgi:CheY-like chemotaxis protein/cytidylate kinase|nr:response regulator [Deltaproteobacteria bacterium]
MSIITLFSGGFCDESPVIDEVISRTGYRLVADDEVVAEAGRLSEMAESKIMRAFSAGSSVFNKFTHEKERSIAFLRQALAELIPEDNALVTCFCGQLIPKAVSHSLRVCLIASLKYRIAAASRQKGISEKEASKLVQKREEDCAAWVDMLFNQSDPWDANLYDIVVPADKMSPEEAAALITDNAVSDVVRPTESSKQALADFRLAAGTQVALAREGHNVDVTAKDGSITLTINKQVIMLSRLQDELRSIAEQVPGVRAVETKVGKGFHKSDIYRKHNFEMPSKVLLVDDEREFVQTLSERLMMRDLGPAVAYDGESALNLINEDEPDVMIVDLKMPGIDGFEVLRKVKETRPEIEVIVLTGQGHEEDRERCMQMGAFAYLQKPLDINELSEIIKKKKKKIRRKKESKQ